MSHASESLLIFESFPDVDSCFLEHSIWTSPEDELVDHLCDHHLFHLQCSDIQFYNSMNRRKYPKDFNFPPEAFEFAFWHLLPMGHHN